jgi:hypothetical protein
VLSNPVAHEGGLSRKASLAQFTPELASIVTTLLPALAQIFAMAIGLRGAGGSIVALEIRGRESSDELSERQRRNDERYRPE